MPVTIKPASHGANVVHFDSRASRDPSISLLRGAIGEKYTEVERVMESSFSSSSDKGPKIYLQSRNGFVQSAIHAYSYHHHLRIRPEDVWFAILTQLSRYINANAEELRSHFVNHEGKKDLRLRADEPFSWFAQEMGKLVQQNLVDPGLRDWIMPAFSTTTDDDKVVASIIMMATLQKYFKYTFDPTTCGLPSVTLLGERADWEKIELRLEKLRSFGKEPTQWLQLLKPVLARVVRSFDNPTEKEVVTFWSRIAHMNPASSGSDSYSGWITAFCFWNDDGKCMYTDLGERGRELAAKSKWEHGDDLLCLDDAVYIPVDTDRMPSGYSTVPVKIRPDSDPAQAFESVMVAGSVGIEVTNIGIEDIGIEVTNIGIEGPSELIKPSKPSSSGRRSIWESFGSGLMAACCFGASSEPKPETNPESKPETNPESKPETNPESKPETDPESKPETDPESKPETDPEPKSEQEPEPRKFNLYNIQPSSTVARSSTMDFYDPGTDSGFWAASTAGKGGSVATPSAPSELTAGGGREEMVTVTETGDKGRPMDTINAFTGWWIYKKKEGVERNANVA